MSVELAIVSDSQTKQKDDNPYEEYMWMGEGEDEFEQGVMAQLEEEEYLQNCLEDMLEEEALGLFSPPPVIPPPSLSSVAAMPLIENLNLGSNSIGGDTGPHGNGDVILMPTNEVYGPGAGGDAERGQSLQEGDPSEKSEHSSDSESYEGCPQR